MPFKPDEWRMKRPGGLLVWIDESGFARDMPRRYGYAPVGQRRHGRWDWHAKGRTHVIGALLGLRLIAVD